MANKLQIVTRSAATVCASLLISIPFIFPHEGEELQSYEDVVGVWTICSGITAEVKPGMTKTKDECDALSKTTIARFAGAVSNKLTVEVSPPTLAAHTSFAYNIGMEGYGRSSALRLSNAGDLEGGCRAMMIWHTAGGKDCRIRENNCYGVITRRHDEIALCLSGIKKELSDAHP